MGYRIGDVERPLDPPQEKYYCVCDSCGEDISYGADAVHIKLFDANVHEECHEEYIEDQLGIKHFVAEEELED